ncbi:MAG: hemolysin family protein [Alphaproteobacteria bacterium]|nr:hemolysin family protein [Alphaproteobacteria bacterium]MCD8562557.1 hemolysin family protein [Alphaproteobacteria bacterium]
MPEEEDPPSARPLMRPEPKLTSVKSTQENPATDLDGVLPPASTVPPPSGGPFNWLKKLFGKKPDTNLREALEEYIENQEEDASQADQSVTEEERDIIANVLELQDTTVKNIMIPRADIAGIECHDTQQEVFALLGEKQYSRFPVYKETLDDILGTIHIKDIISCLARGEKLVVRDLVRDVPIVSPSMRVLDLLRQMRETRKHMALVVDEFGSIDGLVTVGDIVEAIIGEIDDEYDPEEGLEMTLKPDGSVIADARVYLEEFEDHFGITLGEEDKEDNDTLGGLVFSIAGRVPERGEILTHDNGMIFEVLEADGRRVNRVRISNIPGLTAPAQSAYQS